MKRNKKLELYWGLAPLLFLIGISITPLLFIYVLEVPITGLVKSVTGNQWYWIYGCVSRTNFFNKNWSSAMVGGTLTARDSWNTRRYKKLQWAISSHDVIHNWGIAGSARDTLGVKMDAYPGRCNVSCASPVYHSGLYTGYCSELCGEHHTYMPIVLNINMDLVKRRI